MSNKYDIEMSIKDTLELDAIIQEWSNPDSIITDNNNKFNMNGYQTNTGVLDPKEPGEHKITVNGQELIVNVNKDQVNSVLEDFESGSLNNYSGDTGSFTVDNSPKYEGEYALNTSSTGSSIHTNDSRFGSILSSGRPYKISFAMYPQKNDDFDGSKIGFSWNYNPSTGDQYSFGFNLSGNNGSGKASLGGPEGGNSTGYGVPSDNWYEMVVEADSSGTSLEVRTNGDSNNILHSLDINDTQDISSGTEIRFSTGDEAHDEAWDSIKRVPLDY